MVLPVLTCLASPRVCGIGFSKLLGVARFSIHMAGLVTPPFPGGGLRVPFGRKGYEFLAEYTVTLPLSAATVGRPQDYKVVVCKSLDPCH